MLYEIVRGPGKAYYTPKSAVLPKKTAKSIISAKFDLPWHQNTTTTRRRSLVRFAQASPYMVYPEMWKK
jgi:hypothetical protein